MKKTLYSFLLFTVYSLAQASVRVQPGHVFDLLKNKEVYKSVVFRGSLDDFVNAKPELKEEQVEVVYYCSSGMWFRASDSAPKVDVILDRAEEVIAFLINEKNKDKFS